MRSKFDGMERDLDRLFESFAGGEAESCTPLSASGSHRKYFRIAGNGKSAIGVIGTDADENRAFITIARQMRSKGLNVPEVYAVSRDMMVYLQEDLGDEMLYDAVAPGRSSGEYSKSERELLLKAVSTLPAIQFGCADGFDFSVCYPDREFNSRMVDFDLNYFKYCFLKTSGIEFNETLLQDDFDKLKEDLLSIRKETFMYRDFQARNVMLKDGVPYFIDFQGGRKGPLHYDLASFVWQARAQYPQDLKEEMIRCYLDNLKEYQDTDEAQFRRDLKLFVLFRTLQVLGAYGFRGRYEKRSHFLESIPFALRNLQELIVEPFTRYPYLNQLLGRICEGSGSRMAGSRTLEVHIISFSFKKGIPADESGNGGGYVFDCRSIHNPGRYDRYKNSTGRDADVIKFLEDDGEAAGFMENVYGLVDPHVRRYIGRGFSNLMISFGCTGGQHRSVYCAESLCRHLRRNFDIRVKVSHREQGWEEIFE